MAGESLSMFQGVMDVLTGGHAVDFGRVDTRVMKVSMSLRAASRPEGQPMAETRVLVWNGMRDLSAGPVTVKKASGMTSPNMLRG